MRTQIGFEPLRFAMLRFAAIFFISCYSILLEAAPGKGSQIDWQYKSFDTFDYGVTIFSGAIALGTLAVPVSNIRAARLPFDEKVRNNLRLENERNRLVARDASDTILTIMTAYPIMVDSLVIAAWYRNSPETAKQMALINTEVIAITLALTQLTKITVNRERPLGRTCGSDLPNQTRVCEGSDRYHSFLSGHSSQTFAMAAVTCTHHLFLPLYGGGFADKAVCGIGFTLAATTALLRIAGDKHYATDVLAGAALGTAVGFLVPWLGHYRQNRLTSLGSTKIIPGFNSFRVVRVF